MITSIENTSYGNFYMKDDTGEVYVYGLVSEWIGGGNDQSFSELGLKAGDTVTLWTLRAEFGGSPQAGGSLSAAIYKSHVEGEPIEPEPDPDVPEGAVVIELGTSYQDWASVTDGTYGPGYEAEVDGFTIGHYQYNNNNAVAQAEDHIRIYQNGALRVKSDKVMTNIIMYCESGRCYDMTALEGDGTYQTDVEALTIEWNGSASEIVAEAASKQVRINKIAIVCE